MKIKTTILFFLTFLLLFSTGFAQAPQGFNYQAVVRDDAGDIVADQSVGIKISILQGSVDGTVVYSETHAPTTNTYGLVILEIGDGTVVSGDLSSIDWEADTYFLKVEMDATGGTTYTEMGTSQILSVPYALHSKTAENVFSGDYDDLSNTPTNVSTFTNDAGYLTSYTETDPVFGAHAANGITSTNITNWSTAYGWGDHSTAGYFADGGEAGGTDRTLGNTDDYSLGFKTNDVTRLYISNTGNVGIGTTNPTGPLHISTSGNYMVKASTSGASDLIFNVVPGSNKDFILNNNGAGGGIALSVGNSKKLIVANDGNIGIGTTSPDEKLTFTYDQFIGWEYSSSNSSVAHKIGKSTSGAGPLEFITTFNPGPTGQTFSFKNPNDCMTILYNGYVGIGTTEPGAMLEVADYPSGTNDPVAVRITNLRSTTDLFWELRAYDSGAGGPYGRFSIYGGVSATDRLVITTNGRVGIGTTDPKSKLHVVGLPEYADNTAALGAGLTAGALYRTGDLLKVVH